MRDNGSSELLAALVRLVVDWTSEPTQAAIVREAGVEIDLPDMRALYMLGLRGECRLGELADTLHRSAPTTSKQYARLSARGLVVKRADPEDSRATLLALTPDGEAAVAALNAVTLRRVESAVEGVPDPGAFAAEVRRFTDALLRTSADSR